MRSKVGILFQEGGLFDSMNIAENVAYPLLNQRARQPPLGRTEQWTRECEKRCVSWNWSRRSKNFPANFRAACAAASASPAPW